MEQALDLHALRDKHLEKRQSKRASAAFKLIQVPPRYMYMYMYMYIDMWKLPMLMKTHTSITELIDSKMGVYSSQHI